MTALRRLGAALAVVAVLAGAPAFAADKAAEGPPVVRFIDLPPLSAAILRDNRVRGLVTVQIAIEILEPEKSADVQSKLPRVQATLLNAVQRHAGRLRSTRDVLDIDDMMNEMQRNADIVVGGGTIRPLIQNVSYSR